MDVTIEENDRFVKAAVSGRLTAAAVEEFKDALLRRIDKQPNLLLDLSGMVHIDSSGLGALVYVLQKCRAGGGACRLACLQSHPKIVFDLTKVNRVFEIFETVEEAEKTFV